MTYLSKPYKITEVKNIVENVRLFKIKSNLNPEPGEFIEVSIPGFGECPLASCSYDSKKMDLLVRKAGNVTSKLFDLEKGDEVFVRGAYGRGFPLKELEGKNLILVAGGTGIAPVTSLIEYIEQNQEKFGKVNIYFGFRNQKYILLKERIKRWKKKFEVVVCLDEGKDKDGMKCEKGFIHEAMEKHKPFVENSIALMCGPEIMMKSVTEKLNKFGLEDSDIYWSMERRMECGLGNCNRCLIQDLYVCKDGPVFRYDVIKPRLENENSNEVGR